MCEEHSPYSDFIPTLFKETGVKRRRMKFETVEDIFLQAEKLGVKEIIPSTMGEPLLYKEFDKIFELSEQKNIKINLTTNGTFPKKSVEEWAKLIVPNTTDVKISWNGSTKETSEKIMQGIDFEKAIENYKDKNLKLYLELISLGFIIEKSTSDNPSTRTFFLLAGLINGLD
jgi:molybdenum cofactor biosynthesis enzyme MoaA